MRSGSGPWPIDYWLIAALCMQHWSFLRKWQEKLTFGHSLSIQDAQSLQFLIKTWTGFEQISTEQNCTCTQIKKICYMKSKQNIKLMMIVDQYQIAEPKFTWKHWHLSLQFWGWFLHACLYTLRIYIIDSCWYSWNTGAFKGANLANEGI